MQQRRSRLVSSLLNTESFFNFIKSLDAISREHLPLLGNTLFLLEEFISKHLSSLVQNELFLEISQSAIQLFIGALVESSLSELEKFKVMEKWMRHKQSQDVAVCSFLLDFIQLERLTINQLWRDIAPSKLISYEKLAAASRKIAEQKHL